MEDTIKSVVDRDLCHGCGTCVSSCPLEIIEMTRDERRGIYVPQLDPALCNNCGVCLKVCPGHSVDFDQLNMYLFSQKPADNLLGFYTKCYSGYSADEDLRYGGASGGIVTTLLVAALEEGLIDGALVSRMSELNPLEPAPFIARTRDEIISAARSKYCPVPANIALGEILNADGKYAVVGLPCHIHGIRKFEQINKKLADRIVLHIGIFCGYTYSFLATDYLLLRNGIDRQDVRAINYRGEGWPGMATIRLHSGRDVSIPYFETFNTVKLAFCPWRCFLCCDGSAELADISCGDAWLPEFAGDSAGTSVIVSRTAQGEDILQKFAEKGYIEIRDISPGLVLTSQPGFFFKKAHIRLFSWLTRARGKEVPEYKTELGKMNVGRFFHALLQAIGPLLASRRYLWRFIPALNWINRCDST